jgi:hypothetical protein
LELRLKNLNLSDSRRSNDIGAPGATTVPTAQTVPFATLQGNLQFPAVLSLTRYPSLSALTKLDALSSAESTQMKFIQRMNEQPSSWFLLFATLAIVGYLLYLVGDGMNW